MLLGLLECFDLITILDKLINDNDMKKKNQQWEALGRKLGFVDGVRQIPEQKIVTPPDMKAVVVRNSVTGAKVKWLPG